MRVSYTTVVTLAVLLLNLSCCSAIALPLEEKLKQQGDSTPQESDLFILATEVQVIGASKELTEIVRNTISTREGRDTSNNQLQADITAILATGLFVNAQVKTTSNLTGVNVVYVVESVVVKAIQRRNANVLSEKVALELFRSQIGQEISLKAINQSQAEINRWYARNGYLAAKVIAVNPSPEGVLTIDVVEGTVSNVLFRFLNRKGNATNQAEQPIKNRTNEEFLRREIKVKPGDVISDRAIELDLRQLYQLGLFRTVNVALVETGKQVDVVYE